MVLGWAWGGEEEEGEGGGWVRGVRRVRRGGGRERGTGEVRVRKWRLEGGGGEKERREREMWQPPYGQGCRAGEKLLGTIIPGRGIPQ